MFSFSLFCLRTGIPDDTSLLSQELFLILISLGLNIEANDKLLWLSCIELKNSILKMAVKFQK